MRGLRKILAKISSDQAGHPLRSSPPPLDERGQSVFEYMLVLCVVVGGILMAIKLLRDSNFFYKKFTEPLVKQITYNYKYGDPTAQGWDEGSPKKHIQISRPNEGQTFRLFQPRE